MAFGMERSRSTSILKGRLGNHSVRAHATNEVLMEDRDRHVSFCAERGVEVVQFSVDHSLPSTTRGPRRVFGGELQAHMGPSGNSGGSCASGTGLRPHVPHGLPSGHSYALPNVHSSTQPSATHSMNRSGDTPRTFGRPGMRESNQSTVTTSAVGTQPSHA